MYVLIGGINSFAGPIIGTVVLFLIPELFLRDLKMYTPYISAGILLLAVYLAPEGLAGLPRLIRLRSTERRKEKKAGYAS
jgi:ABC-type branched-subunit amino acid transport system permease subunit